MTSRKDKMNPNAQEFKPALSHTAAPFSPSPATVPLHGPPNMYSQPPHHGNSGGRMIPHGSPPGVPSPVGADGATAGLASRTPPSPDNNMNNSSSNNSRGPTALGFSSAGGPSGGAAPACSNSGSSAPSVPYRASQRANGMMFPGSAYQDPNMVAGNPQPAPYMSGGSSSSGQMMTNTPPHGFVPPHLGGGMPSVHMPPTDYTDQQYQNGAGASPVAAAPEPTEEDLPVATPVSFSESRLPKLFECPETKTPEPATPIKLTTAWQLYADDHQTLLHEVLSSTSGGGNAPANGPNGGAGGNGSGALQADSTQLTFDPVLIATVKTLEEFWRLWRYITPPSVSSIPFTYSWFRENITPDWEHPRNRKGGTMSLYVYDRDRTGLNDRQNFDDVFQAVVLACAGECFAECATTVNGVMLKLRQSKPATLQIWTAHGESGKLKNFAKSLREIIKPILGDKYLQKIEFFLHPRNQPPQNSLASRLPKHTGPDLIL